MIKKNFKKVASLTYCGKNNCYKIYNYLYENSTIHLDRKYEKFLRYYS